MERNFKYLIGEEHMELIKEILEQKIKMQKQIVHQKMKKIGVI